MSKSASRQIGIQCYLPLLLVVTLTRFSVAADPVTRTLSGDYVSAICSPNTPYVALIGETNDVVLWPTPGSRQFITLKGHAKPPTAIFSPDGTSLFTASEDRTIRKWNIAEHREIRNVSTSEALSTIAVPTINQRVYAGTTSGNIFVWSVDDDKLTRIQLGHASAITKLAISANEAYAAGSNANGTVKVWDLRSNECRVTIDAHQSEVVGIVFSPDGSRCASGSISGVLAIASLAREPSISKSSKTDESFTSIMFSSNGDEVITGDANGAVRLWDSTDAKGIATLGRHEGGVSSLAVSRKGNLVASCGSDGGVYVWDIKQRRQIRRFVGEHDLGIMSVGFSGRQGALVSIAEDRKITFWENFRGQ